MNRRRFISGLGLSFAAADAMASPLPRTIGIDGTKFHLWHEDGRLMVTFSAPTLGWVAAGFNNHPRLEGTRFVIGAMIGSSFFAEEHIAVVPSHPTVQELGLKTAVEDVAGTVSNTQTTMQFSLPRQFVDSDNPTLVPGTLSHVMLAWSHHTDFSHHSAWRRQIAVEL